MSIADGVRLGIGLILVHLIVSTLVGVINMLLSISSILS